MPAMKSAAAARPVNAFVAHCLELLSSVGRTRARSMFGGHGLYVDDVFVALIAEDRLYLKVNPATEARFRAAGCEPFVYHGGDKPMTMSYWSAPDEALDAPALMAPWARLALQAALEARSAKPAAKVRKPASPAKAGKPAPRPKAGETARTGSAAKPRRER